MRKLHEATGGQPQRWESLGNLARATPMRRPSLMWLSKVGY